MIWWHIIIVVIKFISLEQHKHAICVFNHVQAVIHVLVYSMTTHSKVVSKHRTCNMLDVRSKSKSISSLLSNCMMRNWLFLHRKNKKQKYFIYALNSLDSGLYLQLYNLSVHHENNHLIPYVCCIMHFLLLEQRIQMPQI